jgi:hypothetical protein
MTKPKEKKWEERFDTFISSFVFYGEPVGGTVLHNETKEFVSKLLEEQRTQLLKEIKKELQFNIDNQTIPASYEKAHYKMGLEEAIKIIEKFLTK